MQLVRGRVDSMNREQHSLRLIDIIYEAAVEPPSWKRFVEEMSQTFDGSAVALYLQLPGVPLSRRFYAVEGSGRVAALAMRDSTSRMWDGIDPKGEHP